LGEIFAWVFLGLAVLCLVGCPIAICRHVNNGLPIIASILETLPYPLGGPFLLDRRPRTKTFAGFASGRLTLPFAMETARLIKSKNPHSMVEVKDLQSGDVTAVAQRPG